MLKVSSIHVCGRCGKRGKPRDLVLEQDGETHFLAAFYGCDECIAETNNELDAVRPIFNAMIACSIHRALANDIMTYLLNRLPDRETKK